jgi:hypothetical protein
MTQDQLAAMFMFGPFLMLALFCGAMIEIQRQKDNEP